MNTAKMPGKETGPVAGRKQLIDERRAGGRRDLTRPCRTYSTNHKTGHKRVQRFPAGGFPSRLGGCQGLIQRVGLTLPRPLSAAEMLNLVATLCQVSVHTEIHHSQGPIAKPPPGPPKEVRWTEDNRAD